MGCCSSLRQVSPRQKMSEGKATEVLWMVWCLLSESTANKVIVLELPQNRYLCSLRISRTEPCSTQHLTLHGTGSSQSPMSHRAMCRLSVWCRVVSICVPPPQHGLTCFWTRLWKEKLFLFVWLVGWFRRFWVRLVPDSLHSPDDVRRHLLSARITGTATMPCFLKGKLSSDFSSFWVSFPTLFSEQCWVCGAVSVMEAEINSDAYFPLPTATSLRNYWTL